ncbi:MAG: LuxR C-terminal-related transcriptional regulator [Bacteroidota bacterium]
MDNKIRPENQQVKLQPTNQPTNSLTLLDACKRLSRRECEVLDLLAEGKCSSEIADDLYISKSTVENHITTIGKKLNLSGRGKVRKWLKDKILE